MTTAEMEREAPRWIGYAVRLTRAVKRPPGYSPEDWRSEALLGLAEGLKRYRRRPGYLDTPGAPAEFLRTVIVGHLHKAQASALRNGRPELRSAVSLDGVNRSASASEGDPLTFYDTVPDRNAREPFSGASERETLRDLRSASESLTSDERRILGYLLRGIGPADAARDLGVSEQRASERMRKVRAKVRSVFA